MNYLDAMPYLTAHETLAFSKTSVPHQSPTRVSEYDTFGDNLMYESLPPDHVFKLIENLEWRKSIVQLKINKHIARQWVINAGTRRLPLHEACVRKPTAYVIYTLLEIYPDGAKAIDSSGRYPIHHACANDASAQIISQLFYIFPESVDAKDNCGKTPKEYCLKKGSPDVEVVEALFQSSKGDMTTSVFQNKRIHTEENTGYNDYVAQKSNQSIPYKKRTITSKSPAETTSTFHMEALGKALEQSKADSYSSYVQRERDDNIDYLPSVDFENKIEERSGVDSILQAGSRRDITFSQIGQGQHDRKAARTTRNEANPQNYVAYAEVREFERGLNGSSHVRETTHFKSELSNIKDDALTEIIQLKSKIANLENQLQDSTEKIVEKDNENNVLRNINKDLRVNIISLSKKINSVTKQLDSAKDDLSAASEVAAQFRALQDRHKTAQKKVIELENNKADHIKIIDKLNNEIEELNLSYFDITNTLVDKSKDYFVLKAELDKMKQINNGYYQHYG